MKNRGGNMKKLGEDIAFDDFCGVIDQFASCMDDFPYVYDLKNDLYFISDKALDRFLMETNLFSDVSNTLSRIVYPDDYPELTEDLQKMLDGEKDEHSIQYRWIGKDGKPIWIHCKGRVIKGKQGEPLFMLGCVNEIGNVQQADNISGLWKTESLEEYLDQYKEPYPEGFFMYLGLDGFKSVVERLGVEYGNSVLHEVAKCIEGCLAPGQKVYRAVSDEFIIMDFSGGTEIMAEELYRRIRAAVDGYIEATQYEAIYTISAGVVLTSDLREQNYSEVIRLSRFALSRAKELGRNLWYHFEPKDYEEFLYKRNLLLELRKAVSNNYKGFDLYFQPITNAETGEIFAAESLCRFFIDGKIVSPAEFIPILEESGLIIPVGKWIVRKAVEMCKECQKIYPDFKVSVNLSYVQIMKSAITQEIFRVLKRYDLAPESLIVELTESGYLENTPAIRKVWERLRQKGVQIAIDDFGTGYSNLQSISSLEPNIVKIDRGFTVQALSQEYMNHLLSNIIHMSHSMNLMVCIEGIETEEELSEIRRLDPNFIQGFYYGRPCNREEFLNLHIKK